VSPYAGEGGAHRWTKDRLSSEIVVPESASRHRSGTERTGDYARKALPSKMRAMPSAGGENGAPTRF
jgi:hypothetical protein